MKKSKIITVLRELVGTYAQSAMDEREKRVVDRFLHQTEIASIVRINNRLIKRHADAISTLECELRGLRDA